MGGRGGLICTPKPRRIATPPPNSPPPHRPWRPSVGKRLTAGAECGIRGRARFIIMARRGAEAEGVVR